MELYDEGKENRKLLYTYLRKFFGSEKAQQLIVDKEENLFGYHGLAWSLGKRSIEFFCKYFLQDTFIPKPGNQARELCEAHYELWNIAEDMFIKDKVDMFEAVEPRGHAKTTIFDFAVSTWLHAYEISMFTLVAGRSQADSEQFLSRTKQAFKDNQYIIQAFGKLVDANKFKTNSMELELTNVTKIQAISSGSSMRGINYNGIRPNVVIADDYQGKNDIITEDSREKKYRTFMDDVRFVGDEAVYRDSKKVKMATKFIVLGTILHNSCLMSRLLKNKSFKHIVRRAILVDDIDELYNNGLWAECKKIYFNNTLEDSKTAAKEFYLQHKADMQYPVLWPDKWDCFELASAYYDDPVGVKQELQNDASKLGDRQFKSIRTMTTEEIEANTFIKTMLCIDPKGTNNKNKKTEDYAAFCVGSESSNGFKYVRKGEILKIEYEQYISHTLQLLRNYSQISHIYIEKNTYMGADVVKLKECIDNDPQLRYRRLAFINEMQKKNKDEKISTIVGDVNGGRIIFNSEDVAFTDQILDFAGQEFSTHDDAPDITAEFSNRITTVQAAKPIADVGTASYEDIMNAGYDEYF